MVLFFVAIDVRFQVLLPLVCRVLFFVAFCKNSSKYTLLPESEFLGLGRPRINIDLQFEIYLLFLTVSSTLACASSNRSEGQKGYREIGREGGKGTEILFQT